MKNFIELTTADGKKMIANINQIQRVIEEEDGSAYISGITNNGGIVVREDYDLVLTLIKNAQL